MYRDMNEWNQIRLRYRNGERKSKILEETGMHWQTLEKILANPKPPGYRMEEHRSKPKLGPFIPRIQEMLQSDRSDPDLPKKQRHTAKRIYDRIRAEGYTGGYTQVQEEVQKWKQWNQNVFIPLHHPPGEAQVDFGFALICLAGQLRKIAYFVMALSHSDSLFVMTCERECTETFWEGHVRAFQFFGGVPHRIIYDNSRIAVAKIKGAHKREVTDGFSELQSHYLFNEHFCCVRRPNEKGIVEGGVK